MNKELANEYYEKIKSILMDEFVDFWTTHSVDKEYGGFLCGFDRDGELFHVDKSVWQQGRSLWMFSKLYNEFGGKQEWLDAAKSGYDFINKYCFDEKKTYVFQSDKRRKASCAQKILFF